MEVCRKLTNMIGDDKDDYNNFKETELCLGLPGGGSGGGGNENDNDHQLGKNSGKRGFSETIDLQLNLQSSSSKDSLENIDTNKQNNIKKNCPKETKNLMPTCSNDDPAKESPASKAQVVGWPPVRSFRKNIVSVQKDSNEEEKVSSNAAFVKVSMDGAPYLRKVDLRMYKSYQELSDALGKMFSSFTIGNCESQGMKDFMNESKLMDLLNGSEYLPTYEDKDGDWMLAGDVPWEMFVDSCKRLRIMKGSDAIGLAPRAVEKCKNRS